VALNPPSPLRVRPLQVTLASIAAIAVFVVVIALVARSTADDMMIPRADAGPAAPRDAGSWPDGDQHVDGGDAGDDVLVTVDPGPDAGPEPDAGPPDVEPPPYDPAVVAAAAVVVVERCVQDALRWDPSLGGAFTLRVILPVTPLTTSEREPEEQSVDEDGPPPILQTPGLVSPVLDACLARHAGDMARAPGTKDLGAPQAVVARAVLHANSTIAVADAVIVAVPTMPQTHPTR
jgi:hypothetical protein